MDTQNNSQPITKQDWDELITIIQQSFGGVHGEITTLDNKITTLDNRIETLDNRIETLDNRIETLDNKIETFRTELTERIEESERNVLASNEHIAKEISDMRAEQAAILGGRTRVSDTLLEHDSQLKDHGQRITILETSAKLRQTDIALGASAT
jgi:chromosome segregation ATPase